MVFVLSPELRADLHLSDLVEGTRGVLSDILGPSADEVEARWSLMLDHRGRDLLLLKLADSDGVAREVSFAPTELESLPLVRNRFRRAWGDLLQARLEGIVGNLKAILASESCYPGGWPIRAESSPAGRFACPSRPNTSTSNPGPGRTTANSS